ncbi:MAG: hypothetical protein MR902_03925 [Campylobacter sp.]|nr:hypothetical protein [Campylobacter sp.]
MRDFRYLLDYDTLDFLIENSKWIKTKKVVKFYTSLKNGDIEFYSKVEKEYNLTKNGKKTDISKDEYNLAKKRIIASKIKKLRVFFEVDGVEVFVDIYEKPCEFAVIYTKDDTIDIVFGLKEITTNRDFDDENIAVFEKVIVCDPPKTIQKRKAIKISYNIPANFDSYDAGRFILYDIYEIFAENLENKDLSKKENRFNEIADEFKALINPEIYNTIFPFSISKLNDKIYKINLETFLWDNEHFYRAKTIKFKHFIAEILTKKLALIDENLSPLNEKSSPDNINLLIQNIKSFFRVLKRSKNIFCNQKTQNLSKPLKKFIKTYNKILMEYSGDADNKVLIFEIKDILLQNKEKFLRNLSKFRQNLQGYKIDE